MSRPRGSDNCYYYNEGGDNHHSRGSWVAKQTQPYAFFKASLCSQDKNQF